MSTEKEPNEPEQPDAAPDSDGTPQEITLRDGESVSFSVPQDGTAHITVNMVPPARSEGFFSSCLQGCGCLVLIIVILGAVGSFVR